MKNERQNQLGLLEKLPNPLLNLLVNLNWWIQVLDLGERETLCNNLRSMGVDARKTIKSKEEIIQGKWPRALIDISGSPIKWVSVKNSGSGDEKVTIRYWVYVPKSMPKTIIKIGYNVFYVNENSFCEKIEQCIRNDAWLMSNIKEIGGLTILGSPSHHCWVIEEKSWGGIFKPKWECCEKIADMLKTIQNQD